MNADTGNDTVGPSQSLKCWVNNFSNSFLPFSLPFFPDNGLRHRHCHSHEHISFIQCKYSCFTFVSNSSVLCVCSHQHKRRFWPLSFQLNLNHSILYLTFNSVLTFLPFYVSRSKHNFQRRMIRSFDTGRAGSKRVNDRESERKPLEIINILLLHFVCVRGMGNKI